MNDEDVDQTKFQIRQEDNKHDSYMAFNSLVGV